MKISISVAQQWWAYYFSAWSSGKGNDWSLAWRANAWNWIHLKLHTACLPFDVTSDVSTFLLFGSWTPGSGVTQTHSPRVPDSMQTNIELDMWYERSVVLQVSERLKSLSEASNTFIWRSGLPCWGSYGVVASELLQYGSLIRNTIFTLEMSIFVARLTKSWFHAPDFVIQFTVT